MWIAPAAIAAVLVAAGRGRWWAPRTGRRPRRPGAGSAQITIAVLPFQNLGGDPSIDYLRLALPDEIATTLSYIPSLAIRPFAAHAEVREGRRGSAGRRARAQGRGRSDRPLPEGGRPAPRHARGRRHGEQPPPLARQLERRGERPDRSARPDLATPARGPLSASRRRPRPAQRRGRHAAEERRGLRPLPPQQALHERPRAQPARHRDARALRRASTPTTRRPGRRSASATTTPRPSARRATARYAARRLAACGEGARARPESHRGRAGASIVLADRGRRSPRSRRPGARTSFAGGRRTHRRTSLARTSIATRGSRRGRRGNARPRAPPIRTTGACAPAAFLFMLARRLRIAPASSSASTPARTGRRALEAWLLLREGKIAAALAIYRSAGIPRDAESSCSSTSAPPEGRPGPAAASAEAIAMRDPRLREPLLLGGDPRPRRLPRRRALRLLRKAVEDGYLCHREHGSRTRSSRRSARIPSSPRSAPRRCAGRRSSWRARPAPAS